MLLGASLITVGGSARAASAAWVGRLFGMSYPVDPAGSHMLVFKTKPCKSKYKQFIP